ncbi:MAG: M48 family metalloprotease, partial [Thalassobaculaceae bacterium]
IGHLRGGHVLRTRAAAGLASKAAVLSMILGAAAVAAGQGDAGAALLHGGRASATGAFLAFSRGQEAAADQTALALLAKTGQSPRGLYDFMALLAGQEALLDTNRDAYGRTHPFSRDRLAVIERALTPARARAPAPRLAADFARLHAKLTAYLRPPARVRQRFPTTDQSLPARYARAIAAHRAHQSGAALAGLDALIATAPKDPFLVATRAEFQLESGDAAGAETSYRAALRLAAAAALSQTARALLTRDLATALLAGNSAVKDTEARDILRPIAPWAGDSPGYWRQRAIAHGRLDEAGAATLAHAEAALRRGRIGEARDFAARARRRLKAGTPEHLRALDIENAAKNQLETR